MSKLPFMSVVIASYQGEHEVGRAIEAVLNQDYPRDRYEIIVVNDGSTDKTAEVISRYPVTYLEHPTNRGVAAARNAALAVLKGDICVNLDDDCIPRRDWLQELARGYDQPNVAGVGGRVEAPTNLLGIIDHFMAAVGSGNPPSLKLDARRNPLQRLLSYALTQLQGEAIHPGIFPVRELAGATASFPAKILRAVGGWDETLSGVEDTDVCQRIAQKFPDYTFFATNSAVIVHDPKMSFRQFARRPYRRGPANLAYYRRHGLVPPIFPFPLIWLAAMAAILYLAPQWSLLCAVALPQVLYFWWPWRGLQTRELVYMIFPYIQMIEEGSTIAGLIRGYMLSWRKNRV